MREKQQAFFITDLGFGDAGKGTITDFLARRYSAHTLVRYNGGPQAAHNVVCADGRHHTFSQFASGMFLPGTRTLLSRFMLINPLNMLKEARHLNACGVPDALERVQIDRRALVITPFQRALNRLRELARSADRHGSCGEGIGECMADFLQFGETVLFAGDLADRATLLKKLRFLQEIKQHEFTELARFLPETEMVRQESALLADPGYLADCLDVYSYFSTRVEIVDDTALRMLFARPGTLLFEGAQGILLDENYGFSPYTTWSTTTCANAQTLLEENAYAGQVIRLGVMRTYATRHGAGPFPTEDPDLAASLPEAHNIWNNWQRAFRVGHCDLVASRYACEVNGKLDYLAITHADRLELLKDWRFCTTYSYEGPPTSLSPYFEHSADTIHAMRVRHPADLAHQEQLTQRLRHCSPNYTLFSASSHPALTREKQQAGLAFIEEQLDLPIAITSYGPTAGEKVCSLPA